MCFSAYFGKIAELVPVGLSQFPEYECIQAVKLEDPSRFQCLFCTPSMLYIGALTFSF